MNQQNHLYNLPEELQELIWQNVQKHQMKIIQKEIKIEYVLKQFKNMISEHELALTNLIVQQEREKLQTHEQYYRYWCADIFEWCD